MRCLSDRKAKSSSQNHSCLRSAVASRWEKASNATRARPLVSITKTRSTGLGLIVSDSLPGRDLSWSHGEIGNSNPQAASLRSHLVRSALGSGADLAAPFTHVRFSNRPFEVKHFQTIHHCSVDVAHGLVLLFGIGTKALPAWDPRTGGTIFGSALPLDKRQVQADMRTHLIHRPARDIIPPLGGARVSSYRI